ENTNANAVRRFHFGYAPASLPLSVEWAMYSVTTFSCPSRAEACFASDRPDIEALSGRDSENVLLSPRVIRNVASVDLRRREVEDAGYQDRRRRREGDGCERRSSVLTTHRPGAGNQRTAR